ncbi:MAG: hypothetical protein K2J17_07505 [Paramuribaculum sp.]|nr:hypothetical protein [Paramuribaculum sp.]
MIFRPAQNDSTASAWSGAFGLRGNPGSVITNEARTEAGARGAEASAPG